MMIIIIKLFTNFCSTNLPILLDRFSSLCVTYSDILSPPSSGYHRQFIQNVAVPLLGKCVVDVPVSVYFINNFINFCIFTTASFSLYYFVHKYETKVYYSSIRQLKCISFTESHPIDFRRHCFAQWENATATSQSQIDEIPQSGIGICAVVSRLLHIRNDHIYVGRRLVNIAGLISHT